jgi:hypothetical protein
MGANPQNPPPPPKPPPVPAPVALGDVNTLDGTVVIVSHIWQEYHWKAPTAKYLGKTDDDKKVAENVDATGALIAKRFLNTAFCESAMTTMDLDVPAGQKFFMRWWLEDSTGTKVAEHPDFSKAHYDGNNALAQVKTAKYAWRWDGRLTNAAGRKVFLRDEDCWSKLALKSVPGRVLPLHSTNYALLRVQGEPYRVFVMGIPKTDAELDAEKAGRGTGRWLHTDGAKIATDCWIKVYRGVNAAPAGEEFLVFLGHGAIEATGYDNAKNGAIATPHDREYRAWIKHRHWRWGDFSLCEIANVAPAAGDEWLITLDGGVDSAGAALPPANNPYCDTRTNQPFKDGVQGHMSFNQGGYFLIDDASTGCTTIVDVSAGTRAKPAAVLGNARSIKASYGGYYGGDPTDAGHKNKIWGPALEGGRPGTFYNKQNKRSAVSDSLLADDYAKPLVNVPRAPEDAAHDDEPLHMQPTFQHGLYGGYMGHEIAASGTIKDDPDTAASDDPKMRIRCRLNNAPEASKAWQYHRLVCFGHIGSLVGAKVTIEMWVPRLMQRPWNGHMRNVMIKDTGMDHCEYAWFFEQRNNNGTTVPRGPIGKAVPAGKDFVTLDVIGKLTKEGLVKPTFDASAAAAGGAKMFSVFKYRVKLLPAPAAGVSVWQPLSARVDLFSDPIHRAQLADEQIVKVGADSFLTGKSELELTFI